jgi:hypothetical protein
MKQPKIIMKTGSNSEEFEVENPDYKKRNPMKHLTPKKKKRK